MKAKEISASFIGSIFLLMLIFIYLYNKVDMIQEHSTIEYKMDRAAISGSSRVCVFGLNFGDVIIDTEVSIKDFKNYNKGDAYIHEYSINQNNIYLTLFIICIFIIVILIIIFYMD